MREIRSGVIISIAIGALAVSASVAFSETTDPIEWAFPGTARPSTSPPSRSEERRVLLPGSNLRFNEAQLHDDFSAVDWWPDSHPASPLIVRQGHQPATMACGFCHLPAGQGRPENAALAGLPSAYIVQQIADMRNQSRNPTRPDWGPAKAMHALALAVSLREVSDAAAYFSSLAFHSQVQIVESREIPAVVPDGFVYRTLPGTGRTQLGSRIVEVPDDFSRFELRDNTVGYTAYVPVGAVARGRGLALTGDGGRTQPCQSCHGANLTGGIGPPLAGRSPTYIFRQLYAFHTGDRHGPRGGPMKVVTARLSLSDMIDLAAYVAMSKP